MTDSKGPYKVVDGVYIEGPGVTYRSVSEFDAEAFARFGNLVHARAHHTARRQGINQCIDKVVSAWTEAWQMDDREGAEMLDELLDSFRALLGAGENKPADARTSSKEADNAKDS